MELILWRHADAEDGVPDHERALTARGRKQATRMGHWLQKHLPAGWILKTSPAVRALQTASGLAADYVVEPALAPGAAPGAILRTAGWPHHPGVVVVVGHQPGLGAAAALALTGEISGWSMKKGSIWWLSGRGERDVVVRAVINTDLL